MSEYRAGNVTEAGKKGRGGYLDENDYSESQKRSQRVRGEFLTPTFKAKATFAFDSVTFNTSCVRIFPENQHVALDIDEPNLRVIARVCEAWETFSLKFAVVKDGKNAPRRCVARHFCRTLFEMMEWHTGAKYRTLAIVQKFFGETIIVFNLDECLQVFTETFEEADGQKKRTTTINMPGDWKGRFGYTLEELEARQRKLENSAKFIRIDNKTGERHGVFIEPKLPTPEELMHRPYGGLRTVAETEEENGNV